MRLVNIFTKNIFLRGIQQGIMFLIGIVIAKFLGSTGNGVFSLFITDVSFFILLVGFCGESAILFYASGDRITFLNIISILIPLLVMQVLACIIFYWISSSFLDYSLFKDSENSSTLTWAIIFILSNIIFNYFNAYLNFRKIFFQVIYANIFLQIVFLVLLLVWQNQSIGHESFIEAKKVIPYYTCIYIGQMLVSVVVAFKKNKKEIVFSSPFRFLKKDMLLYMLTIYVGNIVQFFAYKMDLWLLDYYHSFAVVGVYAMAAKLSQVFWILPQLMAGIIFPLIILKDETVNQANFRKLVKFTILILLVIAVIMAIVYPLVIVPILGNSYTYSYTLFLYLVPGALFFAINLLIGSKLSAKGFAKVNMQASVICFLLILILDLLLIPTFAGKGAAIASSIGYSLSSLYSYLKYRQISKSNVDGSFST